MKIYLKLFMEWVTNLRHNLFEQARIKLSLFYCLIIFIILSAFSIFLLNTLEKNISDTLGDEIPDVQARGHVLHSTVDNLENLVLTIDLIVFLLTAFLSYYLSGKTLKPIKEVLELQKRFTADASHDLRTPLAIITTETEVLLSSKSNNIQEYKNALISNLEEANKMKVLVSDLLTLARTENLNNNSNLETVEIKNVIHNILQRFDFQMKAKNISLSTQYSVNGNISIHKHNFERVIQNILQNAINYTKENGTISVNVSKIKSNFVIEIQDNGVGISQKDLPYIYDRFYKAEHSRNDNSGSGLGLAIAKQIILQHGGQIKIESEIGVGTKVIILIKNS